MSVSLSTIPPELYSAIINQVPPQHVLQTVVSLSRALPRSPVPQHHLFEFIYIRHAPQVFRFYRRLRLSPLEASWVNEFALETWSVDAQLVVNLLKLLRRIHRLSLWIGPTFAPEHLEELLEAPQLHLQYVNLRFNPYVSKARYEQFLKGAYFDSTILTLARWPPSRIPSVSIIQDPFATSPTARQDFAQPIVFFRLDALTMLVRSPFARALTSFRLRIPARQVARFVCALPGALPVLTLLDLSTCNVLAAEVEPLVGRFARLRHLVLDGCSVLRGGADEADWSELGRACALGGVRRARERERKLKEWLEANAERLFPHAQAEQSTSQPNSQAPGKKRKGRRGIANATVSLRDQPSTSTSATRPKLVAVPKIRVIPAYPTLQSFATTASAYVTPAMHPAIRDEFTQGWHEGIKMVHAVRARLRTSWNNGVRVMRIADLDELDGADGSKTLEEEGFDGLVDLSRSEAEWAADDEVYECPVLCLAGTGRGSGHAKGCGHAVGWSVWDDEL